MAKITLSALVTDISGSIGGGTIQRSQGGFILRNKPLPRNTYTPRHFQVKNNMSKVQYAWKNLSDSQRNLYASFLTLRPTLTRRGSAQVLKTYNLFVKYNLIRLAAGMGILYDITLDHTFNTWIAPELLYHLGVFSLLVDGGLVLDYRWATFQVSKPFQDFSINKSLRVKSMIIPLSEDNFYDISQLYFDLWYKLPAVGDQVLMHFQSFSPISPAISLKQSTVITVT